MRRDWACAGVRAHRLEVGMEVDFPRGGAISKVVGPPTKGKKGAAPAKNQPNGSKKVAPKANNRASSAQWSQHSLYNKFNITPEVR